MEFLKAAIVPVIWGTTYVVTSEVLPPGRPILAAVLRALPAGLLLLLWQRRLPQGRWWAKATTLALFNFTGFFGFLFLAAYMLPNGVASVLTNTSPLVVMALAPALLGTRLQLSQVVAGLLAVCGVAALTLTPGAHLTLPGVVAGLAASVCMGTGTVLAKKWGRPEGVSQLAVTSWQLTLGGLMLTPFLAWEGLPERLTGSQIAGYAYLCIFGALIAYMIWFKALAALDAVRISLLAPIAPLVATLIGVFYVGESLSVVQALGGLAILAALVLAQGVPRRRSRI
ncbi:EamA family transporter [Corynebacterium epidermidicanis]|uniref:Putative permease, DMT superfamily n=1 Tax=Corynebacterium epidermidicanis TaxID=1050174 RepID=A0A0G3GS95_9CORY|nr:EamA family transporter [Corynebacterium epidermidicanis]AKK03450.1 putative permease, DMT superfamily [Corynebacterium epidermidicanis]